MGSSALGLALGQQFLASKDSEPQGTLEMSADFFGCPEWGGWASDSWWVEARDAAQHPIGPTAKSVPTPSVSNAKVGKPGTRDLVLARETLCFYLSDSHPAVNLLPRDIWQCLET